MKTFFGLFQYPLVRYPKHPNGNVDNDKNDKDDDNDDDDDYLKKDNITNFIRHDFI
jgi:hypothetical protein